MSAISLYQAFIPTSSHKVGVIVDPGAEIIQEVVGWVDVSFTSAFSLVGASCAGAVTLLSRLPDVSYPVMFSSFDPRHPIRCMH
jgi:hypothetical protein